MQLGNRAKDASQGEMTSGGKKESKGHEKCGKGENRTCCTCGNTDTLQRAWSREGGNTNLYAIGEDDSGSIEEALGSEALQAWCFFFFFQKNVNHDQW